MRSCPSIPAAPVIANRIGCKGRGMRDDGAVSARDPASARPVRVLAAGGTIAMRGERAVPALDAAELVEQLPRVAGFHLEAESVLSLPSTHLTLTHALDLARRARAAGERGEGVVLTTGTDTMEEVAMVCALTYGGEAPIVITGANRPGSAPGADGPANLLDAIILARAPAAADRCVPLLMPCRPDRSLMLFSTYGFEGAERDLRASDAICVPFLSPPAARIALLCGLGAGLDPAGMAEAFALFDAR